MGLIGLLEDIDPVAAFLLLSSSIKMILMWSGTQKRLVGHVGRLIIYPIKSMAGVDVHDFECLTAGATKDRFGDRHFLVIGPDKNFVTGRTEPTMLLIKPELNEGKLALKPPDDKIEKLIVDLDLVEKSNNLVNARVHDTLAKGLDCGDDAGNWIDRYLQKKGHRLLFSAPSVDRRSVKTGTVKYAKWTAHLDIENKMAFQDSTSYHILSQTSVDDVVRKVDGSQITADNFRANVIVTGSDAFTEDTWQRVFIGDAEFSVIKLCGRCVLTTVDTKTGKKSEEPLTTLRKYRKLVPSFGESPCLGVNYVLDKGGHVKVGDPVYAVIGRPRLAP